MAYNPNQPRDYRGRWTKANGVTYRQNTPYRELMSLHYFSSKGRTGKGSAGAIPVPPLEAYGFADRERLYTSHHIAHAREMGYKTQREYEVAAIEFWNEGEGKVYRGIDGNFYKYDSSDNRFLVISPGGYIRTFFVYDNNKFERKRVQLRLYEI